jgi:crotonobetainyl-CoA:carnitine CoA-transferase CaiB-like acyl-CoA transferase
MSAVGEPGREPLGPPGAQVRFAAGLYAAIAALSPFAAGTGGRATAGLIEAPIVEAVVATMIYDSLAFQYFGRLRERVGNRFASTQPTIVTLACKDGHIGLHAALHAQWLQLCEVIGHPELVRDPRFAAPADRAENIADLDTYLLPWLAGRMRFEAFHELQRARIPSSAHPTMPEVLASPQLAARDSWHTVRAPAGRTYRVPGAPARVLATSPAGRDGVKDGTSAWQREGLRVLDLSMGWAGPLVSHILASFGADVIKVESHTRFDWWRGSRPPGDDPSLALHERSHVFNSVNRGKRGLTLNLATERGCGLLKTLVAGADVLVENFGAGVMERLGLGYDVLSKVNPGLIMLRQPGFGSTGPEASYLAFGNTIEGMSGLTAMMGYEGGPPTMMSNALGDPISGLNATVTVLSALAARRRDGHGRLLECAQLEGFLPLVSEALLEFQRTGEVVSRRGNARPGHVPSAAFECAEGNWVAIDVQDDSQWAALARQIDEPWAADATLRGTATRKHAGSTRDPPANGPPRRRDDVRRCVSRPGVAVANHDESSCSSRSRWGAATSGQGRSARSWGSTSTRRCR